MRSLLFLIWLSLASMPVLAQRDDLATATPQRAIPLERYLTAVMGIPFEGSSPYLVVELEHGRALFRSEEDEPWGSQAEVAGYRMSRWLGWPDLVPETVPRELGRTDFPDGSWPYPQKKRYGSLQTFLPARPATEDELRGVNPDRKATMEILTFLMGRYDNHLGNTLIDEQGRVFLVDFENGLEHQKVRYGEYPFVQKGQPNDSVPSTPADQPFPFDHPHVLERPTLEQVEALTEPFRAPWSGSTAALQKMATNSLDGCLSSAVWDHRQWLQVKVRSRHPAHTDHYPPELVGRLAQLDLNTLEKDILLPPFTRRHALDILERRDQILSAARADQARYNVAHEFLHKDLWRAAPSARTVRGRIH